MINRNIKTMSSFARVRQQIKGSRLLTGCFLKFANPHVRLHRSYLKISVFQSKNYCIWKAIVKWESIENCRNT